MKAFFDYHQVDPEKAFKAQATALLIRELDPSLDARIIGELLSDVFLECLPFKFHRAWVEAELGDLMTFPEAFIYYMAYFCDDDGLLKKIGF